MINFLKYMADVFSAVFLFIGLMAFFAVCYTNHIWGEVYVEQIITAAVSDFDTIGTHISVNYIFLVFLPACLLTVFFRWKTDKNLWLNIGAVCMIGYALWSVKLLEYVLNQNVYSDLYEKEYVNPKDLQFTFPAEKRNLILLYLESIEEEYTDESLVGENLLPNLSAYQNKELHFNNFMQMPTQSYTLAAMISSMCGIPYRVPKEITSYKVKKFLPNLLCFPQILEQNGYENYILKGTNLDFSSSRKFYSLHGFKHMKDKLDMEKEIDLQQNQGTSWGYRDRTYYRLAKEELLKIAAKGNPFMLVMVTLDTHKPDIYLDEQCEKRFGDKRDIIKCADSMAAEFLSWLQSQDFYKETMVVVIGDHPETGNNDLYPLQKKRKIVNFVLNPVNGSITRQHKIWSTIDLAPTILNLLGVEFGGGKFGLGRSLLKDNPTLYEVYHDRLSNEILKSSRLYGTFYDDLPKE